MITVGQADHDQGWGRDGAPEVGGGGSDTTK